jgi:hypothetical protein
MDMASSLTKLSNSFSQQLRWYEELTKIDQTTLSQLVLSRGDMRPLLASIRQKRLIVDMIERERAAIKDAAEFYEKNKVRTELSPQTAEFERILSKSESVMKEFLEGENQLKRYVEFMMGKTEMCADNRGEDRG